MELFFQYVDTICINFHQSAISLCSPLILIYPYTLLTNLFQSFRNEPLPKYSKFTIRVEMYVYFNKRDSRAFHPMSEVVNATVFKYITQMR